MGQVINVKKIKNHIAIKKIADHNLRQQFSDNVDPSRSKQNLFLIGSPDMNVVQEVQNKLEGIKYRKDANKDNGLSANKQLCFSFPYCVENEKQCGWYQDYREH